MKKSDNIAKLAVALVKFNLSVEKITKDKKNPHFKNNYATVDQIIETVRPLLAENGFSILQFPAGDVDGNVIMTTMLLHESGEWLESDPLIMKPVKNDPQAVGSCITYARRYSLAAILSLNTGEDDDANMASGRAPQSYRQQQSVAQQQPQNQQQQSGNGNVVEIKPKVPSQKATALWKNHKGSLDGLQDHVNKQLSLGFSMATIENNLALKVKVPESIRDLWAGMYMGNAEEMNKLHPKYVASVLAGMTDAEIESKLAESMATAGK